jgi:hypothetical protein
MNQKISRIMSMIIDAAKHTENDDQTDVLVFVFHQLATLINKSDEDSEQ